MTYEEREALQIGDVIVCDGYHFRIVTLPANTEYTCTIQNVIIQQVGRSTPDAAQV